MAQDHCVWTQSLWKAAPQRTCRGGTALAVWRFNSLASTRHQTAPHATHAPFQGIGRLVAVPGYESRKFPCRGEVHDASLLNGLQGSQPSEARETLATSGAQASPTSASSVSSWSTLPRTSEESVPPLLPLPCAAMLSNHWPPTCGWRSGASRSSLKPRHQAPVSARTDPSTWVRVGKVGPVVRRFADAIALCLVPACAQLRVNSETQHRRVWEAKPHGGW